MLIELKDTRTIGMVMDFMCSHDLNYEVVREPKEKIIYSELDCTCCACPVIYEFKNIKNDHDLYFRLRHGYWALVDETDDRTIASDSTDEFDGACGWDDALRLIREQGIEIDD